MDPDVHELKPPVPIHLQEVGVTGISIPLRVALGKKSAIMVPRISAFIDLPASQKGIHASRTSEAIVEAVSEQAGKRVKIEDLCVKIAESLLIKHTYAERSRVDACGEAVIPERAPVTRVRTFEPYLLIGKANAWREGKQVEARKMVGVKLSGMTVCPCSSHTQRSYASIMIEVPKEYGVDALTLIQIGKDSMSAPVFELLKKEDEIALVKRAAERPRFAEDCLRLMAKGIIDRFPDLPDQVGVSLYIKSLESIHAHDFIARRESPLGVLREEISSG